MSVVFWQILIDGFAISALYALGATGLRDCALENLQRTDATRKSITSVSGVSARFSGPTFNEFVVRVPGLASDALAALQKRRVLGGLDLGRFYPELDDCILVTATELTTQHDIAELTEGLRAVVPKLQRKELAGAR